MFPLPKRVLVKYIDSVEPHVQRLVLGHMCASGEISLEWGTASDCLVKMEEEKSPILGRSATDTLWSTITSDKMLNTSDCQLPWEDFVETKETKLDIFIFTCLILTIVLDTFLIAIVLLHSDLRKKAILLNSLDISCNFFFNSEDQPLHELHMY